MTRDSPTTPSECHGTAAHHSATGADAGIGGGAGQGGAGRPSADAGAAGVDPVEVFNDRVRQLTRRIGAQVASLAALQAGLLRLLAEFAGLRAPAAADPLGIFDEHLPEEIAGTLKVSAASAGGQLIFADAVCRRLPHAVQALADGVLDLPRLRSLENATSPLDDTLTAEVEGHVLAGGPRRHRSAFTDACRRAVIRTDPDGAAERAAERRHGRRVDVYPGEDATSVLRAVLPTEDAAACDQHLHILTDTAIRTRGADDTRTRDQIRADTLVDLLAGRTTTSPLPCDVQVIVPVTTLLGLDQHEGEIPGHGPIPAAVAREMAMRPTSTWRRMLVDPAGTLIEVAERRFPSPAQVRHVRARNRHCVHPGCTRRATRTETDHTVPHSAGGPTLTHNLGPHCTRHHHLKHRPERPWKVQQATPGTYTWTSPTGTTHITRPHNYLTGEEHTPTDIA